MTSDAQSALQAQLLPRGDPEYPSERMQALGDSAFNTVYTPGHRRLLAQPLLALFCSERCPGDLIIKACDVATALRDAAVPVVSGFHSPVERECLSILLRGTQPIVVHKVGQVPLCRTFSLSWNSLCGSNMLNVSDA